MPGVARPSTMTTRLQSTPTSALSAMTPTRPNPTVRPMPTTSAIRTTTNHRVPVDRSFPGRYHAFNIIKSPTSDEKEEYPDLLPAQRAEFATAARGELKVPHGAPGENPLRAAAQVLTMRIGSAGTSTVIPEAGMFVPEMSGHSSWSGNLGGTTAVLMASVPTHWGGGFSCLSEEAGPRWHT